MRKLILKMLFSVLALSSFNLLAQEDITAQGEEVYMARCEYCHGEGLQKGGTIMLHRRYGDSKPAVLHQRTDLLPEYIRNIVRTNTPGMTPVRITEVNEKELDALILFLTRNNP
ncbi:MAG: cytochrome c [Gammaproteobacteria bacterium]|nr:cytochrome c [Gammaproteobacteria bacterium]